MTPTETDTLLDVSPRYLAGAGDEPGEALDLLTKKRNWPHHIDPETSSLFISSPCHRIRVAFMGDYMDPWQIVASSEPMDAPNWMARFSGYTPVEIVGAFLETIAGNLDQFPEQVFNRRSYRVKDATQLLEQAGWKREFTGNVIPVTSPDGLAGLTIRRTPEPWEAEEFDQYTETVTLWAGPKGTSARWEANFTHGTPLHVIAAATRSMITPAPVQRHRGDLEPSCLPSMTIAPMATATDRAQAARSSSPAARAAGASVPVLSAPPATPARARDEGRPVRR